MQQESWLKRNVPNTWIRINIIYLGVGFLIGTFLNILFQLVSYRAEIREWRYVLMTYLVSVLITLCITNISLISTRIIRKTFTSPLINIVLNYLLIFLGVFLGTEISLVFIVWLYDVPYTEINHWGYMRFNLVIGVIVGTVIYLYHLQRDNYDHKIKDKELQLLKLNDLKTQAELKTLQARINPHFLYNALNSIASLIQDEPAKAEEMTLKLSRLFRYSINTQDANWASVREELDMVNTYLDIERVRFGDRISFFTTADESVRDEMIPRFILQPLVENALKHGLKDKASHGTLGVGIHRAGEWLAVSVSDNGIPFPAGLLAGYGLQSTSDKLNLLYGNRWKMNFINAPEKKITLELPLINS